MDIESYKLQLVGLTVVLMGLLVLFELYAPARVYETGVKGRAYLTNLLVFGANNLVFFFFNITAVYVLAHSYQLHDFFTTLPVWGQLVLGVLLLDFCIWVWHLSNHKIDALWRFHKAHHSERYLNATSALRFHIGELLLSVGVKVVILVVFGVTFWVFVLYEVLVTMFAAFHHANIRLPDWLQRWLRCVIITPAMHRTHHSTLRDEHDSNYGVLFSWWDIFFRTFDTRQPKKIGLEHTGEKSFWRFFWFPFQR